MNNIKKIFIIFIEMSSTRNRNMPGDYCIEHQKYKQSAGYTTNTSRRFAHVMLFLVRELIWVGCRGVHWRGMR